MLLLLIAPAAAIDGAFDCGRWTSPADAWPLADALALDKSATSTARGVYTEPFEDVIATLLAHVEAGCPYYNDAGDILTVSGRESLSDLCTTSAGDLIRWERAPDGYDTDDAQLGSWSVTIVPASGALTSLTFRQTTTGAAVHTHDGTRYDIDDWSWVARWTGHLGDDYPDDGWMGLHADESYTSDYLDGSWSRGLDLAWRSPTCRWDLTFAQDYDGPLTTRWTIAQGPQALTVDGSEGDTCGQESVDVTLDGRAGTASADGWTRLSDADGDGYCREVDDCAPWNPRVYPGAPDRPGDGVDADCDGVDGH